jgi:hypothetical protein
MFRQLVKHELIANRRLVPFIWLATDVIAAIHLIANQIEHPVAGGYIDDLYDYSSDRPGQS